MSSYEAVCRAVAMLEASSAAALAAQEGRDVQDQQAVKALAQQWEQQLAAMLLAPIHLMTKYQVGQVVCMDVWMDIGYHRGCSCKVDCSCGFPQEARWLRHMIRGASVALM